MGQPLPLRPDFDARSLRALARRATEGAQARRLLALAAIYEGSSRSEAARIGDVTLQVVRDWVLRFNAKGPEGLVDREAPGAPSLLSKAHRTALAAVLESGPVPAIHGVVRWRLIDLGQWLWEKFRVSVSKQTLSREVRALGYRKLSAQPRHHAQAEGAVEGFSEAFPAVLEEIAREKGLGRDEIEVWFADEARVGQKNKRTRRWARRGTRPVAPHDQRTASTYLFGAICPKEGKAAGLVLPRCNTEAMTLHLAEISTAVAPGKHAVLLLDRAGWHLSDRLEVPSNITIVPLPPKCPELNPVENVWQFMRDNWLSNRVFRSYDDIVDHCCFAWNKLVDHPWHIISLGQRRWAQAF
ncbi:IS630 family transposase [Roseomonas sp. BN140053]|uniref:IS630 family transposase n=1 Tax=Roseomonas sp. BN140053 TaxID=3391898 RepID=UPI0039E753FC